MTFPLGSHRNAPTPVVNHVQSSDSQIFSRYSHVLPIFYSPKLMSPTLSTQKNMSPLSPFIISSPIFHLLVDGWTVFTLYFQALAIQKIPQTPSEIVPFFFPPGQQVPKETGLEGTRCFHLLWAEGFGSPSPAASDEAIFLWGDGPSKNSSGDFSCEKSEKTKTPCGFPSWEGDMNINEAIFMGDLYVDL